MPFATGASNQHLWHPAVVVSMFVCLRGLVRITRSAVISNIQGPIVLSCKVLADTIYWTEHLHQKTWLSSLICFNWLQFPVQPFMYMYVQHKQVGYLLGTIFLAESAASVHSVMSCLTGHPYSIVTHTHFNLLTQKLCWQAKNCCCKPPPQYEVGPSHNINGQKVSQERTVLPQINGVLVLVNRSIYVTLQGEGDQAVLLDYICSIKGIGVGWWLCIQNFAFSVAVLR